MKEDLHFTGADYNLLSTFFIIGYVVGQVPSQMVLTRGKIYHFNSVKGHRSDDSSPSIVLAAHMRIAVVNRHILFRSRAKCARCLCASDRYGIPRGSIRSRGLDYHGKLVHPARYVFLPPFGLHNHADDVRKRTLQKNCHLLLRLLRR